jgi:catechol 2,3-dioxygenase-like lactoylglutathione lyase family enzyme
VNALGVADVRLSHCFLPVHDHEAALVFYRDLLGLRVCNDVTFEGNRWVTVAPPGQPDVQIVLEPPGGDPNAPRQLLDAVEELMAKGVAGRLVFTTGDCDALFERLRAAGVEVLQEPLDQPYGVRDCAFRDPSGNMLRFNQVSTRDG